MTKDGVIKLNRRRRKYAWWPLRSPTGRWFWLCTVDIYEGRVLKQRGGLGWQIIGICKASDPYFGGADEA